MLSFILKIKQWSDREESKDAKHIRHIRINIHSNFGNLANLDIVATIEEWQVNLSFKKKNSSGCGESFFKKKNRDSLKGEDYLKIGHCFLLKIKYASETNSTNKCWEHFYSKQRISWHKFNYGLKWRISWWKQHSIKAIWSWHACSLSQNADSLCFRDKKLYSWEPLI